MTTGNPLYKLRRCPFCVFVCFQLRVYAIKADCGRSVGSGVMQR